MICRFKLFIFCKIFFFFFFFPVHSFSYIPALFFLQITQLLICFFLIWFHHLRYFFFLIFIYLSIQIWNFRDFPGPGLYINSDTIIITDKKQNAWSRWINNWLNTLIKKMTTYIFYLLCDNSMISVATNKQR